jgi:hypothetical protein
VRSAARWAARVRSPEEPDPRARTIVSGLPTDQPPEMKLDPRTTMPTAASLPVNLTEALDAGPSCVWRRMLKRASRDMRVSRASRAVSPESSDVHGAKMHLLVTQPGSMALKARARARGSGFPFFVSRTC